MYFRARLVGLNAINTGVAIPLIIIFGVVNELFGLDNVLGFFKNFAKQDEMEFEAQLKDDTGSIAPPKNNDGAHEIETDLSNQRYSSVFQQFYSGQDPRIQNKTQLINTYRGIMTYPEVENAVSEIINEAIVNEQGKDIVTMDLTKTNFSKNIQDKIMEELDTVMNIHDFDNRGSRLFRDWYVDSRIYFHKIMHKMKLTASKNYAS